MVDVIDETFVVAEPAAIAAALHAPALWRELFPGLDLSVFQDRGEAGIRFTVTGDLVGSSEFWVEPWGDGAVVHHYLRADLADPPRSPGRAAVRARTRYCVRLKAGLNALKDRLEAGRPPGTPRHLPPAPS